MPTRYIKESIKTSDTIDKLSWFEEVLFYRLLVSVDDYGRFDGRAAVIKNMLFPLKEQITVKSIESAIVKLANVHLIDLYVVDDKRFLQLTTWTTHQTTPRAKSSKYPAPNEAKNKSAEHMHSTCNTDAEHMHSRCNTNAAVIVIENRNRNRNRDILHGAEAASVPQSTAVIELTLNTGEPYGIDKDSIDKWGELYPAVDVMQELRNMKGWLDANPKRRKTRSGIGRFINSWLAKKQDKTYKCPTTANKSFDVNEFFNAALQREYNDD